MGFLSSLVSQANGRSRLGAVSSYAARFLLVAAAYFIVARISVNFALIPGTISPLWLPAAIALCACLIWGMHLAPAVWLAHFLTTVTAGLPAPSAAAISFGPALEALVATYLMQRAYRAREGFLRQANILRFIGIAVASGMIGASISIAASMLADPNDSSRSTLAWLTWWVGDATGMIVGVPLILAWDIREGIRWRAAKVVEAVGLVVLLLIATQLVFSDQFGNRPLAFFSIPFFIWAAYRFNLPMTVWTTAITCAIAAWNTAHGTGPFTSADLSNSLLLLMLFVSVIASMGLLLANLVYQNAHSQQQLIAERDSLEGHVQKRTEALVANIEERKRVEEQLAKRESQLAEAQLLAHLGSWSWDSDSGTITWSDELYRIFNLDKRSFELKPENIFKLIHEDDLPMINRAMEKFRETGNSFQIEYRIHPPGGSERIVAARGHGVKDRDGYITRMFGTVQDITEARQAERSLREAEERYRMMIELSPDAILVQQDEVIMLANHAALELFGAQKREQVIGKSIFDFLHPDFHEAERECIAGLKRGEDLPAEEAKFIRLDGCVVDVETNASAFLQKGRLANLFILRDITERKKTAEQMAYLAHYDSLTRLPNRTLFHQRLEHALTIAERPGRSLEILFLDLDRFKNINDSLGHATGDLVLQETAKRLQSILRESDTVARLGGDEFVVLVENVDEPHRGGIIAEKILAAFSQPFMRDTNALSMSTSIGISRFPSDGADADTLLKKADLAMYRAKEAGRNSYRYFSTEMNTHTIERQALEKALEHAIELDQLSLHYQPKIDILTNRITGMEALLRWQHPTMGSIPPRQFIPIAEESGLITPIGYWAIRSACQQNKAWQANSPARLKVAVNLSPRQLVDDMLIENLQEILNDTGLEADYLEIEITETAIMANPEKSIQVLNALRDIGITIAIDNFGSGYLSLAHLKRFPIRAVKIDRSFIQGVPFSHGDATITKAIIGLAHSLECSVIAEGAETQQQYDFLRENACDSVQGYYFSEAMPAENFSDLIKVQANLHLH
ncbi:MAG TPA: EAL domain-containing protein [Noviherbaspirillum sp.]|nr:EAL domain-containing protein [Noviherbaspirillum sp.]